MTHIIVGTAGHIDHGKTALVRALTGIDTDRLKEEKQRGISIDLGFAHLDLGGLRIGFVDVPGHERFVRNMLAGATGIDLVLFVVAADESIKPQTREHFAICRLLGIERGIVVLTKADLADEDTRELVRLEVEELVTGSFLESAPVLAVSARTGEGLAELRSAIAAEAGRIRRRRDAGPFRMPVDRAFAMKGFGAVVTGTITSGSVAVDDELWLLPGARPVRVRGIQTHGQPSRSASGGQRAALNLAGIEWTDAARGQTLTRPHALRETADLGCRLQILPGGPPLKNRARVRFHCGTADVEAEVRLLEAEEATAASEPLARLRLLEPVVALPGDRFILRRPSPADTIGGGITIDPFPPELRRADLAAHLLSFERGSNRERAQLLIARAPYGLAVEDLLPWGITAADLKGVPLLDPAREETLAAAIRTVLGTFHEQNPLVPGLSIEEVRSRCLANAPAAVVEQLLNRPELVREGDLIRLQSHRLHLKSDEDEALRKIEDRFREAGLAVPPTAEVLAASGVEPARARSLLQILLRDGRLVRVTTDLVYHAAAIGQLKSVLSARRGTRFGVGEFKDWTGVSRKYAIPLLEFCDRARITRRDGDARLIL